MLVISFSMRLWELVQSNGQMHAVKQSFSGFSTPESILAFFQTPGFRLFAIALVAITLLTLVLHGWALVKMLLEKQQPVPFSNKRIPAPPSETYLPKALLWQSSRVGFMPELGLIDHQLKEPNSNRGESTPTRGGDLP